MNDQPQETEINALSDDKLNQIERPLSSKLDEKADIATKKWSDQTSDEPAEGRVLFFNFELTPKKWFPKIIFKFGTDDKAYIAACFFSFFLFVLIACMILFFKNCAFFDKVFSAILNAFLFVLGVAIGTRKSEK